MKVRVLGILVLVAVSSAGWAQQNSQFGSFSGRVVTEWLPDGRRMKLLEQFSYTAPTGEQWRAPAGSIVDGASIPPWAWPLIGGPFEGRYREASVIHDVACDEKKRPWQSVHRAFYTAMRANGVGEIKAKTMYAAVYHQGPRWERTIELLATRAQETEKIHELSGKALKGEELGDLRAKYSTHTESPGQLIAYRASYTPEPPKLERNDFDELVKAIEASNMSLEQIEDYATKIKPGT